MREKADFNAKTNYGWTPLHGAAKEGNWMLLNTLLMIKKADFNVKDNYGQFLYTLLLDLVTWM